MILDSQLYRSALYLLYAFEEKYTKMYPSGFIMGPSREPHMHYSQHIAPMIELGKINGLIQ